MPSCSPATSWADSPEWLPGNHPTDSSFGAACAQWLSCLNPEQHARNPDFSERHHRLGVRRPPAGIAGACLPPIIPMGVYRSS